MAGTLHFLILALALAVSAYSALPSRSREKFLQKAPAPAPDSAAAEDWHHHHPGWDHPGLGGSDSWYLPEEVHLLEKKVCPSTCPIATLSKMFGGLLGQQGCGSLVLQ